MTVLHEAMLRLPPELQKEAADFIEFLIEKNSEPHPARAFDFRWEGALAHLKAQYTAVELQHKASEWR